MMTGIITPRAMRNFLTSQLNVADDDQADLFIDEGFDSFSAFAVFLDTDIHYLCTSLRKPGGTIQDPGNSSKTISNPGSTVRHTTEMRLKFTCRAAKYYVNVGRTPSATNLAWTFVKQFRLLDDIIEKHQDPQDLQAISPSLPIVKWVEHFEEYLRGVLGVDDIPLTYVVRKEQYIPALADDPIITGGAPYSTSYTSFFDEMIARSKLAGAAYNENNSRVFALLSDALTNSVHSTTLRPFARRRDGREAFLALVKQNLGSSKWEEEIERAETAVMAVQWNGRSSRVSLRKHITNHRIAHNMMIRASQHIIYSPPDEATRVKRLIKSIVSSDMTVIAAITAIKADKARRTDFDEASDFLVTIAPHQKNLETGSHNVSAFTTNTGRTGVELRYHKRDSFGRLSDEQKQELMSWREKENNGNHGSRNNHGRERGGGTGRGRRQGRGTNDGRGRGRPDRQRRNVSSMQSQLDDLTKLITAQTQTIASLTAKNDTGNTNANNSALRRPGTGR